MLYHSGFGNELLNMENKSKAIQCILHHQVFRSRRAAVADLIARLNFAAIGDLIVGNHDCVPIVFPLSQEVAITADDITKILVAEPNCERAIQAFCWFKEYITFLGI